MKSFIKIFVALITALTIFSFSTPSYAQATRTWVSGVGDDVNPCSRTAPCKTFAGAISKTAANGEINCLDPGGFGTVTITKSITIDCTGTFGSVLNSGGVNGIIVNDSATGTPNTIEVLLRGLSVDGGGSTAGLNGVRLISGRSLVMQDMFIQNQNGNDGVLLQPGGAAEVYMEDVTVTDGLRGIVIQPTGANGSIQGIFRNVRIQNNSAIGLTINTGGNTSLGGVVLTLDKTSISGNSSGISIATAAGTSPANVMVTDSVIAGNNGTGINASGQFTRVRVGRSTIFGNGTGVSAVNSAILNTYGTNQLDGNTANGSFTSAIPQQ